MTRLLILRGRANRELPSSETMPGSWAPNRPFLRSLDEMASTQASPTVTPRLNARKDRECFGFEALEVKTVVMSMHGEIDVGSRWQANALSCGRTAFGADSKALLASPRKSVGRPLLQGDQEIIHGVVAARARLK